MEDRNDELSKIREHRKTPLDDVMAEQHLVADVGGVRRQVVLQIGRPVMVSDDEAQCPVAAWGLDGRYPDIHGVDTMHALNLACGLLERRLIDSVNVARVSFFEPGAEDDGPLSLSYLKLKLGRPRKLTKPSKKARCD